MILPASGVTYVPVASAGVTSLSSHDCASALRLNAFERSWPSSSTYRASQRCACGGGVMRARPSDPKPGWLLNGVRYATVVEYLAALERRDERRRRIMALIDGDDRAEENA